jgi:hypothetical protein
MFKHSEPLKGKKDKYINGYGSDSESEEEEKEIIKSSSKDLFQDLINMVKNIEKDLEKIEDKIEKINNEIDEDETTVDNMEGSGGDFVAWASIKDFLNDKLIYYKAKSLHYLGMINGLEKDEKDVKTELDKVTKDYNSLTNQGFLATETESEDEAEEEEKKELFKKIGELGEKYEKIIIDLPLLRKKVESVYHDLSIEIKEMKETYRKTYSGDLTQPHQVSIAQRDDLHKLLSLAGHYYTPAKIEELSNDGIKARRALSQIIIESSGEKKLKETDFLKNEDGYRNEVLFQDYILGIKNPKIDMNTFINTDEFYKSFDFVINNKIYELKTITKKDEKGHTRKQLQYYVPVEKIKKILATGKDAEIYWYVEPEKGWLSTKTKKDIKEKDYKDNLYKLVLKPNTYTNADIVTVKKGKKINQKSYMIREGDSRITKA